MAERLRAVYQFAGCRILDIGCAGGAYVEELLAHGYDAFGSDIMMNSAWMQGSESRYTVADINNLPYVNHSFDTIIAFEILEHLENVEVALAELRRLAKKKYNPLSPQLSGLRLFRSIRAHLLPLDRQKRTNSFSRGKVFAIY